MVNENCHWKGNQHTTKDITTIQIHKKKPWNRCLSMSNHQIANITFAYKRFRYVEDESNNIIEPHEHRHIAIYMINSP